MALFAYLCAHGRRFGAHLGTQWEGAYIAPIIWTIGGVEDAGRVNGLGFGCQGLRNPAIIEKRAQSRPMVYSTFVLCLGLGTSGCSAVW